MFSTVLLEKCGGISQHNKTKVEESSRPIAIVRPRIRDTPSAVSHEEAGRAIVQLSRQFDILHR